MMKEIEITWGDKTYFIKENDTFELGERIEDIVSLSELSRMAESPNFRRIARCYAEMINFAGGHVTPQEVHTSMMDQLKSADEVEKLGVITTAVSTLVEILMDGAPEIEEAVGDEKKMKAAS